MSTLATWRQDALAHALWLLDVGGREYALYAADEAERNGEGILDGLGARVRKEVEKRTPAAVAPAAVPTQKGLTR